MTIEELRTRTDENVSENNGPIRCENVYHCLNDEYIAIDGQNYPVVSDEYMGTDPEQEGIYQYKK